MLFFGTKDAHSDPEGELIYRRVRLVTVVLPVLSVLILLGFANFVLEQRFSAPVAFTIATVAAFAGIAVFSGQVFAVLEPMRRRLLAQNTELRVASERSRALYEAGVKMTSDLSLPAVLQDVVDSSRKVVGARFGAVAVLDQEGRIREFITSGMSAAEAAKIGHIPHGRGLIGHVMNTARPYRSGDITTDPHSGGFPANHPLMSNFLGVPLVYQGKVTGNLYLTNKEAGEFSKEDEEAIQAFAIQAAIAIENARLYEQVQDVAVLEERERIGMDLHDGTIQAIYGVGLKLEYCISRLESDPAEVRNDLDEAIESLNTIIRDIRNYIFDLRPLSLQGSDLVTALHELVTETRVNTLMNIDLAVSDETAVNSLSEYQASQLFAIAHEALANVSKHSQAQNVSVSLATSPGQLRMSISDDGRGMDLDGREHPTGRGLGNMTERTVALRGSFKIDSQAERGTTLTFEVPIGQTADSGEPALA